MSYGNKNIFDHESFYQRSIERLIHLNPEDCNYEVKRLKIIRNKNKNCKLVKFLVFPVSAHQAQLEHHKGHIQLDRKFPYHGAHGRLTYDQLKKLCYLMLESVTRPTAKQTQKLKLPRNIVFCLEKQLEK